MSGTNSISNELESVVNFVQTIFPLNQIERQNVPEPVSPGLFVVKFIGEERSTETRFHMLLERNWQLFYFGKNTLDVLDTIDKLSKACVDHRVVIPIKNSLRYMRVRGFVTSEPFQTPSEVDGVYGYLVTETREARTQEAFEKIMNVSVVIK